MVASKAARVDAHAKREIFNVLHFASVRATVRKLLSDNLKMCSVFLSVIRFLYTNKNNMIWNKICKICNEICLIILLDLYFSIFQIWFLGKKIILYLNWSTCWLMWLKLGKLHNIILLRFGSKGLKIMIYLYIQSAIVDHFFLSLIIVPVPVILHLKHTLICYLIYLGSRSSFLRACDHFFHYLS